MSMAADTAEPASAQARNSGEEGESTQPASVEWRKCSGEDILVAIKSERISELWQLRTPTQLK